MVCCFLPLSSLSVRFLLGAVLVFYCSFVGMWLPPSPELVDAVLSPALALLSFIHALINFLLLCRSTVLIGVLSRFLSDVLCSPALLALMVLFFVFSASATLLFPFCAGRLFIIPQDCFRLCGSFLCVLVFCSHLLHSFFLSCSIFMSCSRLFPVFCSCLFGAKYHNEAQEAETNGNAGPEAQINRKGRPRRPKWKESNAHEAKMQNSRPKRPKRRKQSPKDKVEAPSRMSKKPLGLGPSFTWAFTCVFFRRSRSSRRFGL